MNRIKCPPLHYFGTKWALAEWVISHFPSHKAYVEPFGGGAAVLLKKRPAELETYNDLDGKVVNFFRVARDRTDELVEKLLLTPFAREEQRKAIEPAADELEAARRFFVAGWYSVGSSTEQCKGTRFSKKIASIGYVPQWDQIDKAKFTLFAVAERMRHVQIECRSAIEVMKDYDSPDTLHYLDPPYMVKTRTSRNGYKCEMTEAQHGELLREIKKLKGFVVLSGYDSRLYNTELAKWQVSEKRAQTRGNSPRVEKLWINRKAAAALRLGTQTVFFE